MLHNTDTKNKQDLSEMESSAFLWALSQASNSVGLLRTVSGQLDVPSPGPDQDLRLKDRAYKDIQRPTVMEERSAYGHPYLARLLKLHRDR